MSRHHAKYIHTLVMSFIVFSMFGFFHFHNNVFAAAGCEATASGNWSDPDVWSVDCLGVGGVPATTDVVQIDGGVTVTLDTNAEVVRVIVLGTFNMSSYNLTLNGTSGILLLNSTGTIIPGTSTLVATGVGDVTVAGSGVTDLSNVTLSPVVGGTPIVYTLNGAALTLSGNLLMSPSGNKDLLVDMSNDLTVNGTGGIHLASTATQLSTFSASGFALSSYKINIDANNNFRASSSTVTVSHDWINNGNFSYSTSTVNFAGSTSYTIQGDSSFYNLNVTNPNTGVPVTVTFDAGATTRVKNSLVLQGTSNGGRIKLRSSSAGTKWNIYEETGTATADIVDVKDGGCDALSEDITTTSSSIDSGNNDACWLGLVSPPSNTTPDNPSNLAPNNGTTYLTSNEFDFTFTLSDPDASDYLSYRIQIDDNDDFSSPVVDYTSTFLDPNSGPIFEVGQALGGGTYTVGSVGQTLDNDGYHWRMKVTDPYDAESGWIEADDFDIGVLEDFIVFNSPPADPDGLGPSNLVDGSTGSDVDPELQFTVGVDPEDDGRGFRIQIDDSSDFSSPVVDYTSDLTDTKTEGPFTVGEDPTTHLGAYTVGSQGQTLDPGSYYWRVQSVDVYNHASGWSTANSGAIAFVIAIGNTAPDNPTNLGPSNLINGSKTNDTTPTVTFDLSDADVADTVRFLIQIDNNSDFSSPVSGYVSDLLAQGPASFTIGQLAGGGSYTYGSSGQTLSEGSYYWEVLARDENDVDSGWVLANSGSIAFIVDTTGPNISEVTPVTNPTNDITPAYTFTTNEAGTYFTGGSCGIQSAAASSGSNTISFPTLAEGTYSNCLIVVNDAAGNSSSALSVTSFVVDTTVPVISSVSPASTSYINTQVVSFTYSEAMGSANVLFTRNGGTADPASPHLCIFQGTAKNAGAHTNLTLAVGANACTAWTSLVSGTNYGIAFQGTDAAGNTASNVLRSNVIYDTTAPVISEVTPVTTPTNDTTPNYTFTTDEAGTITYGGDCTSATTSATSGSNTITFFALSEATHSNCTIIVTDTATNTSNTLSVTSFTIDTSAPVISLDTATSITSSGATITWTTDEAASSIVDYGLTSGLGTSTVEADTSPGVTSHSVVLSGLTACTTYYYAVTSIDGVTHTATGSTSTFSTIGCAVSNGGGGSVVLPPLILVYVNPIAVQTQQAINKNTNDVGGVAIPLITKDLKYKMEDAQVKILQKYLNTHGFIVSKTGAGSPGNETLYFGRATEAAVKKFQEAHAKEILIPNKLTKGTGFMGPATRGYINTHQ